MVLRPDEQAALDHWKDTWVGQACQAALAQFDEQRITEKTEERGLESVVIGLFPGITELKVRAEDLGERCEELEERCVQLQGLLDEVKRKAAQGRAKPIIISNSGTWRTSKSLTRSARASISMATTRTSENSCNEQEASCIWRRRRLS
jgi:hypothetical protein